MKAVDITSDSATSLSNLQDDDFYTASDGENCEVVLDYGEHYKVMINRVKIFPKLQQQIDSIGDTIEGSNDGTAYTVMKTLEENLIENWNTF